MLMPCPNNCQDGKVVTPLARLEDGDCELCSGLGMVDPDMVCVCGRPALFTHEGKDYCGRENCLKPRMNWNNGTWEFWGL